MAGFGDKVGRKDGYVVHLQHYGAAKTAFPWVATVTYMPNGVEGDGVNVQIDRVEGKTREEAVHRAQVSADYHRKNLPTHEEMFIYGKD